MIKAVDQIVLTKEEAVDQIQDLRKEMIKAVDQIVLMKEEAVDQIQDLRNHLRVRKIFQKKAVLRLKKILEINYLL